MEYNNPESRRKTRESKKGDAEKGSVCSCVSEVWWKGQGEMWSSDYTVYSSRGERTEQGIAILVHKSIVKSVVQKNVCYDRISALKLKAELVRTLLMQMYAPSMKMTKWKNFMI